MGSPAPAAVRTDIAELEPSELTEFVVGLGGKPFQGAQVYHWIHRKGVNDPAAMTTLSRELRGRLAEAARVATPALVRKDVSSDGTTKFLFRLSDGREIESVFIPDTPAQTFCISTQVGCAMRCAFCLTGTMGLIRHLSAGEIVGQVRVLASELGFLDRAFNIVL